MQEICCCFMGRVGGEMQVEALLCRHGLSRWEGFAMRILRHLSMSVKTQK